MERNDKEGMQGTGGSEMQGDGFGGASSDDAFRSRGGPTGPAGAANTPAFGEGESGGLANEGIGATGSLNDPETGLGASERGGYEGGGTQGAESRSEGMRNRVEEQLDQGLRTTADRMEGIAARLDNVADERMSGEGLRGRAGSVAHGAADRIESTAEYLRENDANTFLTRLEDQVRERPLEMVLAGVATGWLVGKILR